jgi:hypothetical protein
VGEEHCDDEDMELTVCKMTLHPRGWPRGVRPPHKAIGIPCRDLRSQRGVLPELSLTAGAGGLLAPPPPMAAVVHASPKVLHTGESDGQHKCGEERKYTNSGLGRGRFPLYASASISYWTVNSRNWRPILRMRCRLCFLLEIALGGITTTTMINK